MDTMLGEGRMYREWPPELGALENGYMHLFLPEPTIYAMGDGCRSPILANRVWQRDIVPILSLDFRAPCMLPLSPLTPVSWNPATTN